VNSPVETVQAARVPRGAAAVAGAGVLLGVCAGLAVAVGFLLTVLIGRGPASVAVAAAVLFAGGLALSAAVAPSLRRRAPAMLAGGSGAGLMAGGLLLGAIALLIALS